MHAESSVYCIMTWLFVFSLEATIWQNRNRLWPTIWNYYYNHFTTPCQGLPGWVGTRRINHSGFCWSRHDGVAMASAEPYASYLHFAPEDDHASTSSVRFLCLSPTPNQQHQSNEGNLAHYLEPKQIFGTALIWASTVVEHQKWMQTLSGTVLWFAASLRRLPVLPIDDSFQLFVLLQVGEF